MRKKKVIIIPIFKVQLPRWFTFTAEFSNPILPAPGGGSDRSVEEKEVSEKWSYQVRHVQGGHCGMVSMHEWDDTQ